MRLLWFLIKLSVFVLVLLPLVLVGVSIEDEPLVRQTTALTDRDMNRVRQLLKENNPSQFEAGTVRGVSLTEADINLLTNQALAFLGDRARALTQIDNGRLNGYLTLELPENPLGRYINLEAGMSQWANELRMDSFVLGDIQVPGEILAPAADQLWNLLLKVEELKPILTSANGFQLQDRRISMLVQSDPDMFNTLKASGKALMFPPAEQARIASYLEVMDRYFASRRARDLPLEDVLPPLFKHAARRTQAGASAADEHRSLLMALGFYMSGTDVGRMVGADPANGIRFTKPRPVNISLLDRGDLAQHFVASAVIAATAGSALADAVGLFKEISDSQGGSGFSFADLAADRAGVTLGELATGNVRAAAAIQKRMNENVRALDLMPRIDNLPEGIQQMELKYRYGGLEGRSYKTVTAEIERRLKRCMVYRGLI